jgi:hypothetical protein
MTWKMSCPICAFHASLHDITFVDHRLSGIRSCAWSNLNSTPRPDFKIPVFVMGTWLTFHFITSNSQKILGGDLFVVYVPYCMLCNYFIRFLLLFSQFCNSQSESAWKDSLTKKPSCTVSWFMMWQSLCKITDTRNSCLA